MTMTTIEAGDEVEVEVEVEAEAFLKYLVVRACFGPTFFPSSLIFFFFGFYSRLQ